MTGCQDDISKHWPCLRLEPFGKPARPPLPGHQPPGVGRAARAPRRLAAPWARGCLLSPRGTGLRAVGEGLPFAFRCRQSREARESGTNNRSEDEVRKPRKESFILKNKRNGTQGGPQQDVKTEERTTLMASRSQGHRPPCCPPGLQAQAPQRGSSRRSGRARGSCSRGARARAAPASAVRNAGQFQASLPLGTGHFLTRQGC